MCRNPQKPPSGSGTESGQSGEEPGPSKRHRRDPVLELLEREMKRAAEREKREEAREERMLAVLEKIVEKM